MTRLDKPVRKPEDVKTLLPVRESGQQDFEGLLWSHGIWMPRPILISGPKAQAEEENVRG